MNVKGFKNENNKVSFSLQYKDGQTFDKIILTLTDDELFDVIDFADEVLEQSVWTNKVNMKTEPIRRWYRLDATNYRALYDIMPDVMETRFNHCKELLVNFITEKRKVKQKENERHNI